MQSRPRLHICHCKALEHFLFIPGVFGLRNVALHVGQGGSQTPQSSKEQNPIQLKQKNKKRQRNWAKIEEHRYIPASLAFSKCLPFLPYCPLSHMFEEPYHSHPRKKGAKLCLCILLHAVVLRVGRCLLSWHMEDGHCPQWSIGQQDCCCVLNRMNETCRHNVSALSSNKILWISSPTCHKPQQLLPFGNSKRTHFCFFFTLFGGGTFKSQSYDGRTQ